MDGFCNVFLKKRFIKCISKSTDTCYLFTGNIPMIKSIINKIKKNVKNETDYFEKISDEEIETLFDYLGGYEEYVDIDEKKKNIIHLMFLNKYKGEKLVFVNQSINEDDTNEMIINKIIHNCYKKIITLPYLYAWYENDKSKKIPLNFEYDEKNIEYLDFYGKVPKKCIDTSMIDTVGNKIPKQYRNKNLILYEKENNVDQVIYFVSLEEYLEKNDMFNELIKFTEEEIKQKNELKSFLNGLVFKYWPELSIADILFYNESSSFEIRKALYEKQKTLSEINNRGSYIIESEFLSKNVNEKIKCGNYSLTMMRATKLMKIDNTVHLSKIFTDFNLKNEIPFIKLLLNSHDDAFYKVYENSLMYEGTDKSTEKHVTKNLCKDWSDGYNIQTEYGFNYLHSGNIIMIKIYNIEIDIYGTLIIHLNGDIEIIVEHNGKEIKEKDILIIIHDCNVVISEINLKQFYAFEPLNTLDGDLFSNIHSETTIDFLNSGIMFKKEDFEDKNRKTFPNWNQFLGTFIQNFPMYFRVKSFEETEIESQIIGRYNRVDNYSNISTIQSAISAYKNIFEDPEIIIQKLAKDYSKDPDYIRKEYETWEELISMKEGIQRKSTIINESGSEIKIWINQKEDLLIELQNMKSFQEQRRILIFLKTMMHLYRSYIVDRKGTIQRRLFEKVDEYMNNLYEEDTLEEKLEIDTVGVADGYIDDEDDEDDLDALLENIEDEKDDLDALLDDDDDDEIDFDQLGGMHDSDGYYETKSYFLKRLKEYDNDLFKFKSKKKQASGVAYGYPKLCGATDDRQPIAVTDEELDRIDNSYDEGSGRESYSHAISVPRRPKNVQYICPKYWDISKSLSIRPDAVNKKQIVPTKDKGRTKKSILERRAIYWTDANEVKYYVPDISEDSKLLHPNGYGLPCCFNASKMIKGDPEKRRKKKEDIIGEGYISNKDPTNKDKYAHLHPFLMKYFNQSEKTFSKKKDHGFLRKGVNQNDNDYTFTTSPFLQSYFKILTKDNISEDKFIQIIQEKLTKNLNKFQKCPIIHQKFRKNIRKITNEDKEFIEIVLELKETKKDFSEKTVLMLKNEIKTGVFKSNETCYLYQLILSLKNYLDYLKSDENRNDTYILPLLLMLDDINIVIFENINDEIKIKITDYANTDKIGFIYKNGNFYEPILYRYYDNINKEIIETYLFTPDMYQNNHYEIIIKNILSKIKSYKQEFDFSVYETIIKANDDSIQKLFIDNYSNVTYLITKKHNIIPIEPRPIPKNKNYPCIYSFIILSDIKMGMKVSFGPNKKMMGKVERLPFGKNGREQIGIISSDGKKYNPVCTSVCFLDGDVCMELLPSYKKAIKYLSLFEDIYKPISVIKSNDGLINTIIMSNDTYLPIIEEKISTSYEKIKSDAYFEIEKELCTINNYDDERKMFINMKNYEDYILKLGIHHILSMIEKTSISIKGYIKDEESFYYQLNEKMHFTVLKENEIDYIKKLDKVDHLYSKFDENYSIDGEIISMDKKNEMIELIIKIELVDQIKFVLGDPIMIESHKKLRIYEILEPHIDDLFYILKEKDYQKHELDRFITLCNDKNQLCNYPCKKDSKKCKLYVREKDTNDNLMVERIKWTFIEKLLIFGIENKEKIIEERISVHELVNSTNFHEIFFTFSEYKNDILNEIFTKKSKYIMKQSENNIIKKRNTVMKKLDTIPFYIQKLFGSGSSVVFNLTKENNDFITLEKAFSEAKIQLDAETLKRKLLDEIESTKNINILEKYKENYQSISDLIQNVKKTNYRIERYDLELILENLSEKEDIKIGIIFMSSKYNAQKKHKITFHSTNNLDEEDIESVPIIPLYHVQHENEFVIANILVKLGDELNYYSTIGDLYDINKLHKQWVKL